MENSYHYYAFISYATKDSKWAKWLQHKLSYYHIPSSIKKDNISIPQKIRPVFIYEYDMAGNVLNEAIEKELNSSKYLIVICSPNAVRSKYVNREIETFIKLGRKKYIIPFIVDGEVNAEEHEKECFPQALRKHADSRKDNFELRGANVSTDGKHGALVDVVATMLGVRRDILKNRYDNRRKKRIAITAFLVFLAILCGFLSWVFFRPTYEYYADYVDRCGVPQGVVKLEDKIWKHRSRAYRFEYRRVPLGEHNAFSRRLTKVVLVNSAGQPQEHYGLMKERYSIQKLEYNATSGTIKHIDMCNKSGKLLSRWKLSSMDGVKASLIDLLGITDSEASGYVNTSNNDLLNHFSKTAIKRIVLDRDTGGYVTSMSYHMNNSDDIEQSKITDNRGVYRQLYVNDSLGRVLSVTSYDINGNVLKNKLGIAVKKFEYDKWGNIKKVEFFNKDNEPVLNEELYASVVYESDEWGNIVKEIYYGTDGKLCYNNKGVSQVLVEHNKRGFTLSNSFLDVNSLPCVSSDGYSAAYIENDSRGNHIKIWNKGISGDACNNKYGVSMAIKEYDRWGNEVYFASYDANGNLTRMENGVAVYTYKYDGLGNLISGAFFNEEWNACLNNDSIGSFVAHYNDRGYMDEMCLNGIDGTRKNNTQGYSMQRLSYDDRGNIHAVTYYNKDGIPCNVKDGYHKQLNKYDKYGNLEEIAFFDSAGKPCCTTYGFAAVKYVYDALGNLLQRSHFDTLGRLAKDTYGVAVCKYELDELGRCVSTRLYDEEDSLTLSTAGYVGWECKYDERGNITERVNIGVDGKLVNIQGVAGFRAVYDERNLQTLYMWIDENGDLAENVDGVALVKNEYNERGLLINNYYYNKDTMACNNPAVGYSSYSAQYNEDCRIAEECTRDADGNLCINPRNGIAKFVAKYDENGNKTEMYSYATEDSLCVCKFGYAHWVAEYDEDGKLVKTFSYDTDGNIIKASQDKKDKMSDAIKKYDSHRFKYSLVEVVLGLMLLIGAVFFTILWIKKFCSNSIAENFLAACALYWLYIFAYELINVFLLHFGLIPYVIYNYMWIAYYLTVLALSPYAYYLIGRIIFNVKTIFKINRKRNRKEIIDNSLETFLILVLVVCIVYYGYLSIKGGWNVYSNPL